MNKIPSVGDSKRGQDGHIAYLLRQAHFAMRYALDESLEKEGFTGPQFLVLTLINAYPEISGADLARLSIQTPQTINIIVRKLESLGFISRTPHAIHGRVIVLSMTSQGKKALAKCQKIADRLEKQALDLLDANTEAIVRRWLAGVTASLDRR